MEKVRGEITSIDGYAHNSEIYLTLRLPGGHIINIHYSYDCEEIAEGLHETLSIGDLISCAVEEDLDLEQRQSYTGCGVIRQHDPTDVLDDVFEDFLGSATDQPFKKDEIALISIFCAEAAEAVKREFKTNPEQNRVIDAEFSELASAARSETKQSWKKRFLAAIINIGSAIAIDQAIGTSFIVTFAAILKEVIRGITKRYFLDEKGGRKGIQ
ncbi:hypothetical protein M2324_003957 [Rhodovulum sulfidophilum]|uniref:hypothetical protein n=1 Tax=Rhodovulum sulfidophilum TaxID=35806 RepID=UPI0007B55923|nr:hypothetical protein [Rhodovulum sulfidophilum]ANB35195.1 hypothetical protein A6W98_14610 [Rhodovulum sulfidophilum DSM 1374]MCW2305531.1 hypothetical protein [Rhodovulum sulfidophilum]